MPQLICECICSTVYIVVLTVFTELIRFVYTLTPSNKHYHFPRLPWNGKLLNDFGKWKVISSYAVYQKVCKNECVYWVVLGVALPSDTAVVELWLLLWGVLLKHFLVQVKVPKGAASGHAQFVLANDCPNWYPQRKRLISCKTRLYITVYRTFTMSFSYQSGDFMHWYSWYLPWFDHIPISVLQNRIHATYWPHYTCTCTKRT